MTGSQAALLIWSAGAAVCALVLHGALVRKAARDPITSCEGCRERRRKAAYALDQPFAMVAAGLVIAGLLWPVMGPCTLVGQVWRAIRRGSLRHDCARERLRSDGGDA